MKGMGTFVGFLLEDGLVDVFLGSWGVMSFSQKPELGGSGGFCGIDEEVVNGFRKIDGRE